MVSVLFCGTVIIVEIGSFWWTTRSRSSYSDIQEASQLCFIELVVILNYVEHREAEDETLSHWNRPSAWRKQINTRKGVHKKLYLTCKRMCKILLRVSIP